MKETILTRWNDLSVAAKQILHNKEPLKLPNMPKALELLSEISLLISQGNEQRNLVMTYHVSDAIFVKMLLQEANPDLSLELLLPHQKGNHDIQNADIVIAPFSLFLFESERYETFSLSDFATIIFDQQITPEFISENLMVNEAHKSLLSEDNETILLFTDFQAITNALQPVKAATPIETIKPKGEKISLGKSESKKKAVAAEEKVSEKVVETTKVDTQATSNNEEATQPNATTSKKSAPQKSSEEQDPSAFIAVVARNVQRQYIRDYIREHNLQHVLIVTHNRQSARLLEKYLYRARIRSRVVHEKIDEDTATSLFDRYNEGQFTALILMHRVVEDLSAKIKECDSVIFLDFPTVYSEYANRLDFVQTHFKPQHFISIATENDKVWVQALLEEYPNLHLPLVEVDIKPPKKRVNHPKAQEKNQEDATTTAHDSEETPQVEKVATPAQNNEAPEDNTANPREQRNNRRNNRPRQDRNERQNDRRDNNRQRNNNRRRQDQVASNAQPNDREFGDSQSDFFNSNQDEIVNQNRLPFEAGSFEANIARENRRRGRDSFNTPGGIGQSTNGNFLQNITQGLNSNNNPNSQQQNRRNNSNNNNNRNRPPRKNNRKK